MSEGELVKALRHCTARSNGCVTCAGCPMSSENGDVIECINALHKDAAAAIEELQAEVERLKDSNEELRERQTYIDHYGDKWLTSAKDVPTAAYEHGYADGMAEAKAQLPKRGKIVRCRECKWYEADLYANPWGVCFHKDWVANNIGHTVDEDGFCYRGEREVQE